MVRIAAPDRSVSSASLIWSSGNPCVISSATLMRPSAEFHRQLKARAAMEGTSMADYILREVEKGTGSSHP
jgi:hypothetical protein